jgi:opacity protein-like surface antigen
MRLKFFLVAFFLGFAISGRAQVAPAAKVSGIPIGVGAGVSNYNLDYGQGRRMTGLVARGSVGIFHGFGIDVSARSIFMFTPSTFTRMQESTFLAGVYYEAPLMFHVRPFVRGAGGLGLIEFPSPNPYYTRDTNTVYAISGGVEVPVRNRLYLRGEYEYQFWREFQGPNNLTPQGATLGVTYYLGGARKRSRSQY